MPELPEMETTLRGIGPHVDGKKIVKVTIRQFKLRWPVRPDLAQISAGRKVLARNRHAKYSIITFETGISLIHLDMSGSLRIFAIDDERTATPDKHDYSDLVFDDDTVLRYHDPRKFGTVLWCKGIAEYRPLLEKLGLESFSETFDTNRLYQKLKTQKCAVKSALMDNAVVVDVGNIYVNEGLFKAGIPSLRPTNELIRKECALLIKTIKAILLKAIEMSGSTLWGFVNSDGKSGYFQQEYTVYGRHNEPCVQCGRLISKETLGQRGTFYRPNCQK